MIFSHMAPNGLKNAACHPGKRVLDGVQDDLDQIFQLYVTVWIQQKKRTSSKVISMQDGAPCHTSKIVQKWSKITLKIRSKEMWPSSSSDLNCLDN
jgi:hypothetical protein